MATILVAGMLFKRKGVQGYATITKIHKLRGNRFSTSHYAALPGYLACHNSRSHGVLADQQQRASHRHPHVDGLERSGLGFDVALHAGTLAAIVIYFFRDWVQVIANGLGFSYRGKRPDENSRSLLWFLVIATIPAGLAGLKFQKYAENSWRSFYVIGAAEIILGVLLFAADRVGREKDGLNQMNLFDSICIGIAQALAIIPGVSRSGVTITAARFLHFDREPAARFSFLLSAPIIAAAASKDAWDLHKEGGIPPEMRLPYLRRHPGERRSRSACHCFLPEIPAAA